MHEEHTSRIKIDSGTICFRLPFDTWPCHKHETLSLVALRYYLCRKLQFALLSCYYVSRYTPCLAIYSKKYISKKSKWNVIWDGMTSTQRVGFVLDTNHMLSCQLTPTKAHHEWRLREDVTSSPPMLILISLYTWNRVNNKPWVY